MKLFTYGTLKVGGYFSKMFDDIRGSVKKATIKGTMYNIDNKFPGLILQGDTTIQGEVHEYPDGLLEDFDRIEGYLGPGANNLYDRVQVDVILEDGTVEQAITYVFAQDPKWYNKIVSGEWKI